MLCVCARAAAGRDASPLAAIPCDPTVPFEEDPKDSSVYFLDHDYLEALFLMFKKVNGAPACVKSGGGSVGCMVVLFVKMWPCPAASRGHGRGPGARGCSKHAAPAAPSLLSWGCVCV